MESVVGHIAETDVRYKSFLFELHSISLRRCGYYVYRYDNKIALVYQIFRYNDQNLLFRNIFAKLSRLMFASFDYEAFYDRLK